MSQKYKTTVYKSMKSAGMTYEAMQEIVSYGVLPVLIFIARKENPDKEERLKATRSLTTYYKDHDQKLHLKWDKKLRSRMKSAGVTLRRELPDLKDEVIKSYQGTPDT